MLLMVQPSYLTHFWFSIQIILYLQNYLYCNIERGLKCHRDWSVKGKDRIWLCLPSDLGKDGLQECADVQGNSRVVWWHKWCMRGERANNTGGNPGWDDAAGENTPWTPLLKGLKALLPFQEEQWPHSRLMVPPRCQRAAPSLTAQSCWAHTAKGKGSENREGIF